ncbi:trehalase family glycosidase [Nodosilinea sp. P-1105]|uniref:trehalase family glycosidase n=1 Tax=Nodosilinea sp. P-1105 TaxID=2546229 RepID=UPI00146A2495|nr:trehalase family glycosidase [Nodosilinea sp. P-1105]NMF85586.1 alpha,alpha-trehalase [Nodosilinea sp. P-1105]
MDLTSPAITAVKTYIQDHWGKLTRSHTDLVAAAYDEKVAHEQNGTWPVYISGQEDIEQVTETLKQSVPKADLEQITIQPLPLEADQCTSHGLLYLPGDYVVPGGRFNELYGWDAYFIMVGLMHDQRYTLAKSMVDQLLYQVKHYGTVLNANRTYYLNRSQPPLLSRMVLRWFDHAQDLDWLKQILPELESYYYYWMVPPHLNQSTGLSHYFAAGEGPAPEVLYSERDDQGRTHFDRIKDFYRTHEVTDYDVSWYYDPDTDQLNELFYRGDRSMRESGLDPTNRFGPFSIDVVHYAPVCLNVLLYQMEKDLAHIYQQLGHADMVDRWCDKAAYRKTLINRYLWDEESGFYLDYNFRESCRRPYDYATTFYPLWAGLASPHQAQRLVENLPKLEAPGGLRTSNFVSGNQWDAPFGWAPLQYFGIKGLLHYGHKPEALRLAEKFVTLLVNDFDRCGVLLEKYDVDRCSGDLTGQIKFGYSTNEVGFGWTNGVFLELIGILEQERGK